MPTTMIAALIDPHQCAGNLLRGKALSLLLLVMMCCALATPSHAADEFLPPEQAFKVNARLVSATRVEVSLQISPGYYVYREPFRFSATGAQLGPAVLPAGQQKFDENFQKTVETYRGILLIALPIEHTGAPFSMVVVSQGCADAGLCYPPMTTEVRLDPALLLTRGGDSVAQPAALAVNASSERWWDGAMMDRVLRGGHLWQVVGFFFGMGVLLSFTPCVLPMLPILSSLIVGVDQRPSRWRGLALAGAYSLGMALVYTALGLAAGLAGEGFAAALQTPWAIGGFALLLAVFALSMFDVYELRLPTRFTGHLTSQCNRLPPGRVAAVFLMGGLSALIVSPCVTAPLAGALLFISQSGDVVQGGSALFAMAAGMSVPLLLLGASAGRWVPKAGAWMHGVKRLFGLLMLGVALWVAQPVLPIAVGLGLWGLLLLLTGFLLKPFSTPMHRRHALRTGLQRALGIAALTLGIAQVVGAASGGRDPLHPLAHLGSTKAEVGRAPTFQVVRSDAEFDLAIKLAAGRPVMLDFYADWCVSCKEMERFTFSEVSISDRLEKALLLKADVTTNSEAERALLRRFKLFGPPGTLFFDGQGREIAAARVVGFQGARRFGESLSKAGL